MKYVCQAVLASLSVAIIGVTNAGMASAQAIATGDQYSGRAYALGLTGVTVAGVTIADQVIGDTGQLPASGGAVSFAPGIVTLAGVASATVVTEQATGSNGRSSASSSVSTVVVGAGGGPGGTSLIHATLLTADTAVTCAGSQNLASTVATLDIAGNVVAVPANPNTTVNVPTSGALIATVAFRPQSYDAATNTASASAVAVTFPMTGALAAAITGTITISHAESDLHCPPFTLSKTVNGAASASVAAGSDVTYRVILTNQVDTPCQLTSVSDLLPPQPAEGGTPFTYSSGGPPGASVSQVSSGGQNVVTWTFASPPSIAAGGTFAFNFVAHVPSNEPSGTYTNVARYTSTCGAGSGIAGTQSFTSPSLAPVTVASGAAPAPPVAPVPATGSGAPPLGIPVGLGILGAALVGGGFPGVIGLRRKARKTAPLSR